MSLSLIEGAAGDPRNARALAIAADLAYLPQDQGAKAFGEQLGLNATLVSVDNTQAYVAENAEHIVVAFRGTESPATLEGLKDWLLTDAVNLLIVPQGRLGTDLMAAGVGARFHQGFVDAIDEIWAPLQQKIEGALADNERPVWVTGHSLGGALAVFAGWLLQRKFISVHQVYTYGAPMIGNPTACAAIDREFPQKIFRYVNLTDPVPKLPTVSLIANDYQHVQREVALGSVAGAAQSAVDVFRGFVGRSVDGALHGTLVDDLWAQLTALVNAHLMPSYHGLLKTLK